MKHSWAFRWWYILKLKQQISSSFKVKNESEAVKSDAISEIQQRIKPLWLSIKRLAYKLSIKTVQNNRSRLHREETGHQRLSSQPLFTQNQISSITRKYWLNLIVQALFLISEAFLYWLVAVLFVPGGGEIAKLAVALFLAGLGMICLDYGFTNHFLYIKIKSLFLKKEIGDYDLKSQNNKRILGYLLIVFTLAVIIFSGMVRIFFIEQVDPTGLSAEKLQAVKQASKWASLLTMVATIATAIYLAALKREQGKIAEQYDVMRYWKKTVQKKNTYAQELIKTSCKLLSVVEQTTEKHWQLIIEIKRIFKMAQEQDLKYLHLDKEYVDVKSKPGFTINDHIYRKFAPVQAGHEELFRYGVYNALEIKTKIDYVHKILREVEEYLAEQIQAANSSMRNVETANILPAANGIKHETNFQNT
ncbi:MAG: hypothetical protein U0U70_01885 [Chitinophagaceae bacterium]